VADAGLRTLARLMGTQGLDWEGEAFSTIEEAAAVRDIVDTMEDHRMFLHGRVNPNQPGDLELMDELAKTWGIVAWKCYTQYGPGGKGFWLDDEPGIAMIEKARALSFYHRVWREGFLC
jgi:uncharacterized protein